MNIEPLSNLIQIKIEQATAGVLKNVKDSAVEYGEVIAIGKEPQIGLKVGDKIFFKAWAVDIINFEDKNYYFINPTTGGILARVK